MFYIQGHTHTFTTRYSTLAKLHDRLLRSGILDRAFKFTPPNFPGKYWFKDMTKPKNYEKRGQELLIYLRALVSKPTILKFAEFQTSINLPNSLKRSVGEIANNMVCASLFFFFFFFFAMQFKISKNTTKNFFFFPLFFFKKNLYMYIYIILKKKSYNQIMDQFPNESPSSNGTHRSTGARYREGGGGGEKPKNGKQVLNTDKTLGQNASKNTTKSDNSNVHETGTVNSSNKEHNDMNSSNALKTQKSMKTDEVGPGARHDNNMTVGQQNTASPRDIAKRESSTNIIPSTDAIKSPKITQRDDNAQQHTKLSAKEREEQDAMLFKQTLRQLTEKIEEHLIEIVDNTSVEHPLDPQELIELKNEYRDMLEPLKLFHLRLVVFFDVLEIEDEKFEYPSMSGGCDKVWQTINGDITLETEGLDVIEDMSTEIRDLLLTTCDLGGNNNIQIRATLGEEKMLPFFFPFFFVGFIDSNLRSFLQCKKLMK
ncbi:hypothetical protein RFI_12559 [Reticulomyxa filosa]|uniref:PX domain-containing protein n=1 Tax=Reticulomyxa filosa TaxID=46433 RepID=X6NGV8_RETFI|nr:hypothetical protein RFI_12559 [Reticulomyxa filosa]|eukprot:ETO24597.1 hypothetical protein RFI_12559 [Reticulomyxa filosa]